MVQPSFFEEFMAMGIKQWIHMNLKRGTRFGRDVSIWDLLFGDTCWYLWLYCNVVIFETPGAETWSMMLKVREWTTLALAAIGLAGPNSSVSSGSGHGLIRWTPPPKGGPIADPLDPERPGLW
ncbi:hypothetical protein V6N11_082636 [Hibiscus sabdariffa]|uniref:Uncharacterized protein n=1 Tax=Hibiscus sabdariffa TaxID=183260 RepID=A0ABR2P9B7_9ROSI